MRRPNREGFKAGALVAGLEQVIVWIGGELQKTQICVHACVPLYLTVHRTIISCYTVSTHTVHTPPHSHFFTAPPSWQAPLGIKYCAIFDAGAWEGCEPTIGCEV